MEKHLLFIPITCIGLNSAFAYNNEKYIDEQKYENDYQPEMTYYDSYTEPEHTSESNSNTHGYIGAGLQGQVINEKLDVNGIELANVDLSGFGINLNGGFKSRYFRFGLDVSSTTVDAEYSGPSIDYTTTLSDISVVKYSLELAGIIKCNEDLDLELGGTIGRGRYKIKGNWSEWVTPYGFLFGVVIHFNENHAMTMTLKGYMYSIDSQAYGDSYKTKGSGGEFVIGYRYSF